MVKVKSIKITPEQLDEITHHLEIASRIMNCESQLDFDEMTTAHRNIFDALQDLRIIRDNAEREAGAYAPIF